MMLPKKTLRMFAVLVLCMSCGMQASDTIAGELSLQSLLNRGIAQGYPGAAMLIDSPHGVSAAAVGYSDVEHGVRLALDDGFHAGSVNKTFTAAAILRLVDEGKLSLDMTLGAMLGTDAARIPHAEIITLSQLLDHSSGIYAINNDPDYLATIIGKSADPKRVWSPRELVALADKERQEPLGAPGSGHYYSDTNYILLGMIVEKFSGVPFKRYISETFFEPLGMRRTYFYSDYLAADANPPVRQIQGYLLATKEIRSAVEINPMFASVPSLRTTAGERLNTTLAAERVDATAGIITTLADLQKFAAPLFRGKLLSVASQRFLMAAGDGMDKEVEGKHRIWTLQSMRGPSGVLIYKEGDGPGGTNALMAYSSARDEVYIGFINSFGFFDEVEFMINEVIADVQSETP